MVFPAVERGFDIHFDGPVDSTLLYRLNSYAILFLESFCPFLNKVRVSARVNTDILRESSGLGAMTGMNCGVHSLDTTMFYTESDVPDRNRVRSLAVFDVGMGRS